MKLLLLASLLLIGCSKTETIQQSKPVKSSYKHSSALEIKSCDSIVVRRAVSVTPYEMLTIEAPMAGVVDSLYVQKGDTVSPGDTVLAFDSRKLVAEIRVQKLRVTAAKSDMDRVASLYKKGVRTSVEKQSAENLYREESALLRLLRLRLEEYTLISPVGGTVVFTEKSKTYIAVGEEVCQVESGKSGVTIPAEFQNRSILNCIVTFPLLKKTETVALDSVVDGWIPSELAVGTAGVITLTLNIDNCYSVRAKYHGGAEGDMVELVSEDGSVLGEVVAETDSLIYITAERQIDDTSPFIELRVIQ